MPADCVEVIDDDAHKDLGPSLLKKDWLFMSTSLDAPFMLGDHPVVVDNLKGGKRGLGVPGVVFIFRCRPSSPWGFIVKLS